MRNWHRNSLQDGLSPWGIKDDSDDEADMASFCKAKLPTLQNHRKKPLSDRVNQEFQAKISHEKHTPVKIRLSRPRSNVLTLEEVRAVGDRLSVNKENKEGLRAIHKTLKMESKLSELAEISIKNFVVEGTCENNLKEHAKKKQSTFVMKQKFAEIRRSMNQAACSSVSRAFKYTCKEGRERGKEDKENTIFRMTRYDIH